jgi:hypothetical protein
VTSLLNPTQADVLGQLRGNVEDRPSVRPDLKKELQSELELGLRAIEGPLTISKGMLAQVHACEGRYLAVDEFDWSPANAKGTIVHKAIELSVDGTKALPPQALVTKAMDWICESPTSQSLAEYVRRIGEAERAELRNNSTDLVIKFLEMFPPLKPHWHPNAEATTAAYVGNKRVVFQGKIDLKLGVLQADRSSTLIIDIKTGNPAFTDLDDLRFYALLETLRTGVPPYRWANAYVSAGRADSEDASEAILYTALKRTIEGARKIGELNMGRTPKLTPGSACKFCPAREDCPESKVESNDNQ